MEFKIEELLQLIGYKEVLIIKLQNEIAELKKKDSYTEPK